MSWGRTGSRLAGAVLIAAATACAAVPAAPRPSAFQPLNQYCFDGAAPQRAAPDDMHVFDPYIGRFRGAAQRDDATGREFYFTVEYAWFSPAQSVVRFRVAMVVAGEQGDRTLGEGYYGYDAFNRHLYVLGVFAPGTSGFGGLGAFDRRTHQRTTWACQVDAAGQRTYVRDAAEMIDADSWRNITRVRRGETGDWTTISDEIMSRIPTQDPTP